jgi:AraC-like DNA-binding protein
VTLAVEHRTGDAEAGGRDGPVTVYEGATVTIGRFRCGPDDARWHELNSIGAGHHVVFPETPVAIEQLGKPRFVANRNHVVFYNPDQEFRRSLVDVDGDRCSYLVVDADAAARMVWEATSGAAGDGCFPVEQAAASTELFLTHRRLIDRVLLATGGDPLQVEEDALRCAAGVLRAAVGGTDDDTQPPTERQRLVAEAVKELLSVRLTERLTLAEIGATVGMSPFHLTRVFRQVTGQSIHAYRTGLRVRTAVDRIRRGASDLAAVALDVGFASHSHLTDSFRRVLGTTPSDIRRDTFPAGLP